MSLANSILPRAASDHPCFHVSAKARWGRIHLPVAPMCNIQCNYCNRRNDCANESRPGVTSRVLEPGEAVACLHGLLNAGTDISVIGIAGPGDALCDPGRTLETIRAVRHTFPGLLFCLSTNGLNLPEHVDSLAEAGVTHVTVTVNAMASSVGAKIYDWVSLDDTTYRGRDAAELLISRQRDAITRLKSRGIVVKINTVILPGINDDHIGNIAGEVAALGADVMNCIPVIPVAGTSFAGLNTPSSADMNRIRNAASLYMPLMNHCNRCRADASGLVEGNDINSEKPEQDITGRLKCTETAPVSMLCNASQISTILSIP